METLGPVDGDSPAAMRYTEARLAPLAMELMRDLEKDTVRWSLNFDDTLKEPDMLPGRFPNPACQWCIRNCRWCCHKHSSSQPWRGLLTVWLPYIDNPNIKLEQMMKIIKAPDFPTGGELIFDEGLEQAYRTGKGKIIIRSKVNIETVGDKTNLVISEIPYQVNKALLLQKIADTQRDKQRQTFIYR